MGLNYMNSGPGIVKVGKCAHIHSFIHFTLGSFPAWTSESVVPIVALYVHLLCVMYFS